MSGGRAGRRKQKKWRAKYVNAVRLKNASICLNCGRPGPHFVPPGFGTPGFFMCKPLDNPSNTP